MGSRLIVHLPKKSDFDGIQETLLPWNEPTPDLFTTFEPISQIPDALTKHYKAGSHLDHTSTVHLWPLLIQGFALSHPWNPSLNEIIGRVNVTYVHGSNKMQRVIVVDAKGLKPGEFVMTEEQRERIVKWGEGQRLPLLWYIIQVEPGWTRVPVSEWYR